MTSDELRTAGAQLREFLAMRGAKWDASMFDALAREVAPLSEAEFYAALQRCKAELRFPPLPVDITDRCPSLSVQSADEAWTAIGASSERDTVICTDLALGAWGEVASEPDPTARRMAFRKAYERLANAYKTVGRRPSITVSLGTDPHGRAEPIKRAVQSGLLPVAEGRRLLGLPEPADGNQKLLQEPPRPISQGVELTDDDRAYIASWQSPRAETPSETEIRHRLGPYAADKLRLFMLGGELVKTYASGCQSCGCEIPDDVTHCRTCAPAHRARCEERKRKAEMQNQREQAALARMWAATK